MSLWDGTHSTYQFLSLIHSFLCVMTMSGIWLFNAVILSEQGGHAPSGHRGNVLLFLLPVTWREQQTPPSNAGTTWRWGRSSRDVWPPTACWLTGWTEPEPPPPHPGSDPGPLDRTEQKLTLAGRGLPLVVLLWRNSSGWPLEPIEALSIDLWLIIGNSIVASSSNQTVPLTTIMLTLNHPDPPGSLTMSEKTENFLLNY